MKLYNTSRPPWVQRRLRLGQGFTLIELITVIVILGVLAATALPRFMDLRKESRVAKLQGVQSALITTAQQLHSLCQLQYTQCDDDHHHLNPMPATGLGPKVTIWGIDIGMHHGWPTSWDGYGVSAGYADITSALNLEGIFIRPYVGSSLAREFRIADAPDPAACKVTYRTAFFSAGNTPTFDITTTGC